MYFRPANEATTYCEGWERINSRADVVELGIVPWVCTPRQVTLRNKGAEETLDLKYESKLVLTPAHQPCDGRHCWCCW
jgi:hypothetical protein